MKKYVVIIIVSMLFLSVACGLPQLTKSVDQEEPTVEVMTEPTQGVIAEPTQTVYSPPTARPTSNETPVPSETIEATPQTEQESTQQVESSCPAYGIVEFDSTTDCWPNTLDDVFSPSSISDRNKVNVQIIDSRLEFSSQLREDVFLYSYYKDNEYEEVIVRASITKIEPSANQNGFTLLCHVNQFGWYEARIESSGVFEVFQYDQQKKQSGVNPYVRIANGGVSSFKTGAGRENIIEWQCGYDYLRFIVNDRQIWEKVGFSSLNSGGGIGVGLASYSGALPRHVGFEYVEILEP